ncbi:ubiquitin-protein ligase E3 Brl2 [Schizosaccharomyces japonicus yFS275]|uniref:E3 ubiquitin protein ligase n=1 Tax=Schizosaccharomyces japonicus (strain yFS275 / FY16936) TaxID=402676 RepID=B6K254_SCHJY|nr:ubiquitin-protein ligase E3 Brl2 [Schizosaccharomyces japonicus yFS275]EEB07235.1 ubiquitin-protein ligase E3 Brl2 [Schizosaccharomyces japonicus yFS275]
MVEKRLTTELDESISKKRVVFAESTQQNELINVPKSALLVRVKEARREYDRLTNEYSISLDVFTQKMTQLMCCFLWWPRFIEHCFRLRGRPFPNKQLDRSMTALTTHMPFASFETIFANDKVALLDFVTENLNLLGAASLPDQIEVEDNGLAEKIAHITAANEATSQSIDDAIARLNDIETDYVNLRRNEDRNCSYTLRCITEAVLKHPQDTNPKDTNEEQVETSQNETSNKQKCADEDARELQRLRDEQNVVFSSRESVISRLQSLLKSTEEDTVTANSALLSLSQKQYENSLAFVDVETSLTSVSEYSAFLRRIYAEEATRCESMFQNIKASQGFFTEEMARVISEFESQMANSQSDMHRIEQTTVQLREANEKARSADELRAVSVQNKIEQAEQLAKKIEELKSRLDLKPNVPSVGSDNSSLLYLQKQSEALLSEVSFTEKAFRVAHQQVNSKISKRKDELLLKYNLEKTKADQKYFDTMKSRDGLLSNVKNLRDLYKRSNDLFEKSVENHKNRIVDVMETEKKLVFLVEERIQLASTFMKSKLKKRRDEKVGKTAESVLSQLRQFYNNKKSELNDTRKQFNDLSHQVQQNETSLKTHERLKKQLNERGTAPSTEALQTYRAMCKCSVCNFERWKNRVISLCGHGFCAECIQKRIETRQRRCPICGRAFGVSDIILIQL